LTPDQKQAFAGLRRTVSLFTVTMVGGAALTLAPLPWSAGGLACAIAAMIVAVVGIRRARQLPGAQGAVTSFAIGLILTLLLLGLTALTALQWPAQWRYQTCLQSAITHDAQDACLADYERDTKSIIDRLPRQ
jgi:hypothetical protein